MTSPDGEIPNGQYDFPVNTGSSLPVGAAWYADQDEADWRSIIETPMRTSWNKAFEKMLLAPLSYLLAWILGGSPTDWDTLAEVQANLIPALMRLPIKILAQLLGLIPIVGQNIENTLTNYLAATANTAATASSSAANAQNAASSASTKADNVIDAVTKAATGQAQGSNPLTDLFNAIFGVRSTAETAQQQISTGNNGQLLSTGVLDGLQYQLAVFTSNGTFTPPTAPAGYEIAYFIVTAYRGGWGGGQGAAGVGGLPGRDGGRTVARVSPAQMGSSQPVTVGAGGSSNGGSGGRTYLGPSAAPLVEAVSATSSIPSAYGAIASSSRPGAGGRGCTYPGREGEDGGSSAGAEGGEGGSTSSVAGKAGVAGGIVDNYSHGGSGGGGGGFNGFTTGAGGAGGAPGGGGGGGGSNSSSGTSGGVGARGQLDVCTYFKLIGT